MAAQSQPLLQHPPPPHKQMSDPAAQPIKSKDIWIPLIQSGSGHQNSASTRPLDHQSAARMVETHSLSTALPIVDSAKPSPMGSSRATITATHPQHWSPPSVGRGRSIMNPVGNSLNHAVLPCTTTKAEIGMIDAPKRRTHGRYETARNAKHQMAMTPSDQSNQTPILAPYQNANVIHPRRSAAHHRAREQTIYNYGHQQYGQQYVHPHARQWSQVAFQRTPNVMNRHRFPAHYAPAPPPRLHYSQQQSRATHHLRPQSGQNQTRLKLVNQTPNHLTSNTVRSRLSLETSSRFQAGPGRMATTTSTADILHDDCDEPRLRRSNRKFKAAPSTAIPMPSRSSSVSRSDSRSSTVSRESSSGFVSRESSSSSLLSAGAGFSNLNIGAFGPETISTDTDYTDNDAPSSGSRRSKRVKRKREQDHKNTAYDSLTSYRPPTKRAKTSSTASSKASSPHNKMRAQNSRMRQLRRQLDMARTRWIGAHFDSFSPFLSEKARKRLRPRSSSSSDSTIVDVAASPSQPGLLCSKYSLRDYQLRSVNWLRGLRENGVPAILADEMGLGKTIQSIATLAALYEDASSHDPQGHCQRSPSLVVVPLSVAEAWRTECEKWMPSKRCVLFHGPKLQREMMMKRTLQFGAFDVVVTTYEMVSGNLSFLCKFWWSYLVLDEAHRIKNERTHWHSALKQLKQHCLHSVLLTGTPIQNNMHELYALLSFMFGDEVFDQDSAAIFDRAYDSATNKQDKRLLALTPRLIQPFFLRRLKSQVEHSLPPKEEIIVKLAMSSEQRKYYKTFLMAHSALIDAVSSLHGGDRKKAKGMVKEWKKLRALYMNLRKIALHPFLLENLWPKVTVANCAEVIAHSSKLLVLDQLLARLKAEDHRVLIFSCFTMVLDLLEVYCQYRGHRFLRLDGSTSRIRRKIDIMRYNDDPNSPFFIYLISNRAGGLGINLQSADTVIHFDTDWNPQSDLQAQARAHRIGQTKMVKIYRLISKHTVEERILFRSQQKLYLDAIINQGAQRLQDAVDHNGACGDDVSFDLEDNDLLKCIKFGAHKMMDQADGDGDDIDLDVLLERSHKVGSAGDGGTDSVAAESASRKKLLRDLSEENNVADFDFARPLVAGNVFEGTVYEKKDFVATAADQAEEDAAECATKRVGRRRTRTVTVDGMAFEMAVEEDPQMGFYRNCGRQIHDAAARSTAPWRHETSRCWGCDGEYGDGEEMVQCSKCPKTFHDDNSCWRGHRGAFGQPTCSQHRCFECGLKTAECGLILRCLGCAMSYCLECAPPPHWKTESGDGLYFVDQCTVAKHHGFTVPVSTYMLVWCGQQCRTWYETVYLERDLPDLSLTVGDLDADMVRRVRSSSHSESSSSAMALAQIEVEWRVRSRFMPNGVMERLQQNMDGTWPIISALYDALYFDAEQQDGDGSAVQEALKMEEEKEAVQWIRGEHYLQIPKLAQRAECELTAPQWIQCAQCKEWRVIPVEMGQIAGARWMKAPRFAEWRCSAEDGLAEQCDSKQPAPSKRTHSGQEVALLRLQRKWMNARYSDSAKTTRIEAEMEAVLEALKAETVHKVECIGDAEMAEARFIGIGQWSGYRMNGGDEDEDDEAMCRFYEHLVASLREWRIESLKTLMDHLGFFVEQRTKDKDTGHLKVGQIAMSYPKDIVVAKLASFLMFPTESGLHLKTTDFKR